MKVKECLILCGLSIGKINALGIDKDVLEVIQNACAACPNRHDTKVV